MKRALVPMIFILLETVCYGQDNNNNGIDIKNIYSAEGKEWKRLIRPDGQQIETSLEDDVFIFYSGGNFKYNHSGTVSRDLTNVKTKSWSYNKDTNILFWELYLNNGTVKKFSAELTYVDEKRMVMNLSEDEKEPQIVVLTMSNK